MARGRSVYLGTTHEAYENVVVVEKRSSMKTLSFVTKKRYTL